jgi:hypothetical protein
MQYMVEADTKEEAEKAFLDGEGDEIGESEYNASLTEEYNLMNGFEIEEEEDHCA